MLYYKTTSPGRTPTLFEKRSGIFYVHRMLLSYTRDRRLNNPFVLKGAYAGGKSSVMWRCRGIVVWPLDSHAESPGSNPTVARYFCPSARHFIHIAALDPGVKWGPGRMRTELWLSWHVCACKTATGRNAPKGVEKVHSECRIVSESYDRGNNTLSSALIIIWKSAI